MAGFEVVEELADVVRHPAADRDTAPAPKQQPDNRAATQMFLLALKSLSQRAIVAASALVTGGAILSVWLLWYFVLPASPTREQLIGVGMYSVFVLTSEYIRRR